MEKVRRLLIDHNHPVAAPGGRIVFRWGALMSPMGNPLHTTLSTSELRRKRA
jgi:hypothetical protein